jgi:hypothetical protein
MCPARWKSRSQQYCADDAIANQGNERVVKEKLVNIFIPLAPAQIQQSAHTTTPVDCSTPVKQLRQACLLTEKKFRLLVGTNEVRR